MGFGDALMASAQARELHRKTGRKVAIGDGERLKIKPAEQQVFLGNPYLATQEQMDSGLDVVWLPNYSGSRPYIDRPRMVEEFREVFGDRAYTTKVADPSLPWRYTDWSVNECGPGDLFLADREKAAEFTFPFAVIEPHVKAGASPNKGWGFERYAEVARKLDIKVVQLGPPNTKRLPGAVFMPTMTYRDACVALNAAALYIGGEGGTHHAAAALGKPAVVIFGGMTSPANTGYEGHTNLFVDDGKSPCGQRVPCPHCEAAMAAISVDDVVNAARRYL